MSSAGKLRVECPHCSKSLIISMAAAGKNVRCPSCDQLFSVPEVDAPAPAPAPRRPARVELPPPLPAPKRRKPREVEYEEPEHEDDYEEERPRSRRKRRRNRSGLDSMFADTSPIALVFFGLCCGEISLILGLIGVFTCTDPDAKRNATIVLGVGGARFVIVMVIYLIGVLAKP